MADKPTLEQSLVSAHQDAAHLITFWQNVGNGEYKGNGAAFAFQIAAVVLGGMAVGRWLETLDVDTARREAEMAHEKGFASVTVPDDYVMLYALMCARAHITGMVCYRRGEPAVAKMNEHLRMAARDVVKIFGEGTSANIKRTAEMSDDELKARAKMWEQRNSLIYDDVAGRA